VNREARATPRVAVDARPLCHPGTGIYRYTAELLRRLCAMGGEWFLYSPQPYDTAPFDLPNVHHRVAGIPRALRASLAGQLLFPLWLRRDRVQAFWGPRHQLPPGLPAGVRGVLTIHDMVWKAHGETMRFPGRQIEQFFTPRALARADVIGAVSRFTAQEIVRYFPTCAGKLRVIPGASLLPAARAPARPGAYFLFVGTLEPRKNLPRLLAAYRRYADSSPAPWPLKLAGGRGWGGQDIGSLVQALGLSGHVEILGRVDDGALEGLYRGARALLMPSLYEGFGLPVVEALSVGVPAVVSRDSALSEVAGEAGLGVDPQSEEDICRALLRIDADDALRDRLRAACAANAARYDWDRSARDMAGVLLS